MKKYTQLVLILLGILLLGCSEETNTKRVILIGIDGFSTDGLQIAKTPNLDGLIQKGAISLKTRGVMPTVSAPNWGSMLLGAGPEQHGITNNGWAVDNYTVEAQTKDEDGYFPSIFKILKDHNPNLKMGVFYQWYGLADLFNHKYLATVKHNDDYMESMNEAADFLIAEKADFCFFYIDHPDHVGHDKGHYTKAYYEGVEEVDSVLGVFFNKLKDANIFDDSHFIIISDHGGFGKGHGGLSMGEIEVPWIIKGPGIIENRIISQPNNNFNTAATIAYLFDVQLPNVWIGKQVRGAFSETSASILNKSSYVAKPSISIKSGIFTHPINIELGISDPRSQIYYTLDGSTPTKTSIIYREPFTVENSSILRAAAVNDTNWSVVIEENYMFITDIKEVELTHQPSPKYAGKGKYTLFDKSFGSESFSGGGWLGFEGDNLVISIDLGEKKTVKTLIIRCLINESSYIFAPRSFSINDKEVSAAVEIVGSVYQYSIAINEELRNINLTAVNQSICPPGHVGEGSPAWLFVDEIIIEPALMQ